MESIEFKVFLMGIWVNIQDFIREFLFEFPYLF